MAESLREFLDRRERELEDELIPSEFTVAAIRAELDEIRRARNSLDAIQSPSSAIPSPANALLGSGPLAPRSEFSNALASAIPPRPALSSSSPLLVSSDDQPTIKVLVVNVLATSPEFRRYGATTAELRERLKNMFDRDVETSSLSPQLSRLREDGVLSLENGKWKRRLPTPKL